MAIRFLNALISKYRTKRANSHYTYWNCGVEQTNRSGIEAPLASKDGTRKKCLAESKHEGVLPALCCGGEGPEAQNHYDGQAVTVPRTRFVARYADMLDALS